MLFTLFDRPAPECQAESCDALRESVSQRVLDLLAVFLLAFVALPVIGVAAIVVRCNSRGGAFYTQVRLGRGGRKFHILKLRSMVHNCEAASGICWAHQNDPRVTAVGRVLRKFHIDELPQLWNVLCGDMSLVGPRPERPEIVAELERVVPGYCDRLRVNPGVTGLAQIQLPSDQDIHSVRDKLAYDRAYVERRGLGLDLRILFGTLLYLAGFSYASTRRLAFLPLVRLPIAPVAELPQLCYASVSAEG